MRVLVLTNMIPAPDDEFSGLFFAQALVRLAARGLDVTVVSPQAIVGDRRRGLLRAAAECFREKHYRWNGLDIHRPKYISCGRRFLFFNARNFFLSAAPVCRALATQRRFDLVVGYGLDLSAHAAHRVGHVLRRPVVSWAIGSDVNQYRYYSPQNQRLLLHNIRHSPVIVTESDALRREILRVLPGPWNVHTFYKGVSLDGLRELPDRDSTRRQLRLDPNRRYMLSVGRLLKTKGAAEFCQAFCRLAGTHPDLAATWVGDGPEAPAIRRQVDQAGLANRFLITGMIPRAKTLQYMVASDLLAFPTYAEGLPNVVMEAMAAKLPVVVSDVGGVGEIVADGVTGRLIRPRDVDGLAVAIEQALKAGAAGRAAIGRGRELILKYFDVDRNVDVMQEILEQIATRRPADVVVSAAAGLPPGVLPLAALTAEAR